MAINKDFITPEHLAWAADNAVIITEGTCGIGRDCVGVTNGHSWVDYPPEVSFVPRDAYHKHECLAVLVHGDPVLAWRQLAEWLDYLIEAGWKVEHRERTPGNVLDLLFHGTEEVRLVRG